MNEGSAIVAAYDNLVSTCADWVHLEAPVALAQGFGMVWLTEAFKDDVEELCGPAPGPAPPPFKLLTPALSSFLRQQCRDFAHLYFEARRVAGTVLLAAFVAVPDGTGHTTSAFEEVSGHHGRAAVAGAAGQPSSIETCLEALGVWTRDGHTRIETLGLVEQLKLLRPATWIDIGEDLDASDD